MTAREKLLADVEAFLTRHDMNHTRFGKLALNDTAFVTRLRAGKDLRFDTADRVRAFMDTYKAQHGQKKAERHAAA